MWQRYLYLSYLSIYLSHYITLSSLVIYRFHENTIYNVTLLFTYISILHTCYVPHITCPPNHSRVSITIITRVQSDHAQFSIVYNHASQGLIVMFSMCMSATTPPPTYHPHLTSNYDNVMLVVHMVLMVVHYSNGLYYIWLLTLPALCYLIWSVFVDIW